MNGDTEYTSLYPTSMTGGSVAILAGLVLARIIGG